jgi:hypothetical protein
MPTRSDLLKKLGKFTASVGCLYVKKLADIDLAVLEKLIRRSVADMKKRHGGK